MHRQVINDRRTILIIEGNTDSQVALMISLKEAGVNNPLTFLTDGQEVMDYFFPESGERSKLPGLILLDISVPGGMDVLKRLRTDPLTRQIPVVILTDMLKGNHILESYKIGANSVINWSQKKQDFDEAIQVLAEYWIRTCQLPPG